MKKVILLVVVFASLSFTTVKDTAAYVENSSCRETSTLVTTDCASACVTVPIGLSANLNIDATIDMDAPRYRKPNFSEIATAVDFLNSLCD